MTTERITRPADIILQQLGGYNRLNVMIGAKDFWSEDEGNTLRFTFKMCKQANLIKVKLTVMDTYTVEFHKIGRMTKDHRKPCVLVKTFENVYADDLHGVIENFTGLLLSIRGASIRFTCNRG
jgi:hypothetical protein